MSFQGLNTAYTGLRAQQAGLDVTAHNIANAGTEGYTRQRVDQATRRPFRSSVGEIGSGVDVADISRRRSVLQDERVRDEAALEGELRGRADALRGVERLYGELDRTLSADLDAVFAAFDDLGRRPDDPSLRTIAVSTLESFSARVRGIADGLTAERSAAQTRIDGTVAEVNGLAAQIADLNRAIRDATGAGGNANDLSDQRDLLLDDLSRTVGAVAHVNTDGTARVSIDGRTIVDGTRTHPLSATHSSAGTTVEVAPWGPVRPGGELAGLQRAVDSDIPGFAADLDTFVGELVTALNDANGAGYTAPGTPGGPLLSSATGAAGLRVVAGAADLAVAAGDPPETFDGRNATALAGLRELALPSGRTPGAGVDGLATAVAQRIATTSASADRQEAILVAAQAGRESAHGVNLDEEMVALISHQRALEASSRVMSAVDQALDVLINRTGVVGR